MKRLLLLVLVVSASAQIETSPRVMATRPEIARVVHDSLGTYTTTVRSVVHDSLNRLGFKYRNTGEFEYIQTIKPFGNYNIFIDPTYYYYYLFGSGITTIYTKNAGTRSMGGWDLVHDISSSQSVTNLGSLTGITYGITDHGSGRTYTSMKGISSTYTTWDPINAAQDLYLFYGAAAAHDGARNRASYAYYANFNQVATTVYGLYLNGPVTAINYLTGSVGINDNTPDATIDVHGSALVSDSTSVGAGGVWMRNMFWSGNDIGIIAYNPALSRIDTVYAKQP